MANRNYVNGVSIETNKGGMTVVGNVVVFPDGSTYNTATGAFNNAGPGYVKVDGETLSDNDKGGAVSINNEPETATFDFATTNLLLEMVTTHVTVEKHDKPGMHVEVTGPALQVKDIKVSATPSTLVISEAGSANNNGGSVTIVNNGGYTTSYSGGNVYIGGMNFQSGGSSESAVTVKVFVPAKTPVSVTTMSAKVQITDVDGSLYANIKGSGKVTATGASGSVQANIAGSGGVFVNSGNIDSLFANIAGSGKVYFDGTAQTANLSIAGSGKVNVYRVILRPMKSVAGSGHINVDVVG